MKATLADQTMFVRPERVWYIAYGSNVNEARFMRYLEGDEGHAGARDATPPAQNCWAVAPLALRFGGESVRWGGGGVCFVDPDPAGGAYVRAWDVTAEQFEDVFAQEHRRPIGSEFDWTGLAAGSMSIGEGWYRNVLSLDLHFAAPQHPALTFTWPQPLPHNPPGEAYRDTIASGLAHNPALTPAQITTYLDASIC